MFPTGNVNGAIERTLDGEFFANVGNHTNENPVHFVQEVVSNLAGNQPDIMIKYQ